ncbi:MAG TPA: YqgE/AlgH family protein [Candidatus Binataceae bacterium]
MVVAACALALLVGAAWAAGNDKPAQTYFLVAQPDLPDPMFSQSVVLMLPPTGTDLVVGLIVNKPTKVALGKLFPDNAAFKRRTETAYFGGPVDISTPLVLARTAHAPAGAVALFKDVYLNLEARTVLDLLKSPPATQSMRLYLGRAQWTDDQLHNEMLENSWYNVPSDPQYVFSADPKTVWRTLVARAQAIETSAPSPPAGPPALLPVAWPWTASGLDETVMDR